MKLINLAWTCTLDCNLRCKHCYAIDAGGAMPPSSISTDLAKSRIIDPMSRMRARYLSFTGGEPLMREDLPELMKYAKYSGIGTSLVTNGLLLSEREHILSEGLVDSIQVSMESHLKDTNDAIRGGGVYDSLLNDVFPLLNSHQIPFSIAMTPTELNFQDLDGLALLASECGAKALVVRRFLAVGNATNADESVFSNHQKHTEFLESVRVLRERYKGRLDVRSSDPLYTVIDPDLRKFADQKVLGGCSAGIASCSIGIDGELKICTRVTCSLGNIISDDLMSWWNNHPDLQRIRNRDLLEGNCGECSYRWICGGCRGVAWRDKQSLFAGDEQCVLHS